MIMHGNYVSTVLSSKRPFTAVLPEARDIATKTLVLLHGVGTDENEWLINTPLQEWADDKNVIFLCPNGGNEFYTDHGPDQRFGEALGNEFLQKMTLAFDLPSEPGRTGIAGFSMGGYGAIRLGLRYPHYSMIGGFSPAFIFYKRNRADPTFRRVFTEGLENSTNDCAYLYQQRSKSTHPVPRIMLTCGDTDPLDQYTRAFFQTVKPIDAGPVTYQQQHGFHDFSLWRPALREFLDVFSAS